MLLDQYSNTTQTTGHIYRTTYRGTENVSITYVWFPRAPDEDPRRGAASVANRQHGIAGALLCRGDLDAAPAPRRPPARTSAPRRPTQRRSSKAVRNWRRPG